MSKKTENTSKKRGRKTPKLLTVSQLSEVMGVKSQGLYRKIHSGALVRRADGMIDISIPENRAFLKARGYVPSKIRIPRPGTPGRPVKGAARTRGPVVVAVRTGGDVDKTELRKEKIARQCLLLQEQVKVIFEGHVPVTAARLYCDLYLELTSEEYTAFIGEACAALQVHFGITLDDGRAATLANALRRETDSVLQAKRTAIEKFLRSLKRRNVEVQAVPATARKIPDHIRALVADGGLTLARLMALPTKSDTEKVKLALEIQRIEKQTQIARGEWITLARWKRFHGEALRALDQRLYAIPWRIGADLAEVFGELARDETVMFAARNVVWEMSYKPPCRVWQRMNDFRQEKGKNG